ARTNRPRAMTSAGMSASRVAVANSASRSVAGTEGVPWAAGARSWRRSSCANDGDSADWARRATSDLERETYEPEPALAHQLVEVPQALHVRNAALTAGHMGLEVGLTLGGRADRLDAEHDDALVGEPMHGIDVEPGEVVQVCGCPPQALVDTHLDQHRVALLDLLAGGLQRLLHLSNANLVLQRHVGKIEADRLRVEVLERHLVDRGRLGIRIEVTGGIDVRARVIAQRERHRLRCETRLARALDLVVVVPYGHDNRRMGGMGRGPVMNLSAQVNELHDTVSPWIFLRRS